MKKLNIKLSLHGRIKAAKYVYVFSATALILFLLLAFLAGCSGKNSGSTSTAQKSSFNSDREAGITASQEKNPSAYSWYSWQGNTIVSVAAPETVGGDGEDHTTEWKLWTDQVRGTRLLYSGGNAYCAVNTLGIMVLRNIFDSGDGIQITKVFNKRIFGTRTVGRFFKYGQKLYTHLYYNTVLHSGQPPEPALALSSFQPEDEEIRVIPFSFQDENDGWELASLYPYCLDNNSWLMVWKYSEKEKTEFRYTKLKIKSWEETEIDEEQFLEEITPLYGVNAPPEVQRLLRIVDGNRQDAVFDITVQDADNGTSKVFRFGDISMLEKDDRKLIRLRSFVQGGTYFLLLPAGRILWLNEAGEKGEFYLPPLPENYAYIDFVTDGNTVLALWEEQDFTSVRHAGFVYKSGT